MTLYIRKPKVNKPSLSIYNIKYKRVKEKILNKQHKIKHFSTKPNKNNI